MRTHLLLILVSLCTSLQLLAQTRQISGTVTDAQNNTPIVGVTVSGPGKGNSTQTGTDGRFTLSVPPGKATLTFSHVGYESQEVTVAAGTATITVSMDVKEGTMDEVVVTALGIKRDRRSIGYATSTVKGTELQQAGTTLNPALALYGKAAGVGINIGSAGPTGGINIRIRGAAGLESFAKSRPLFVVDGVPIYDQATSQANTTYDPLNSLDYGSGINDINPEDIESMEILKGAKATVLYGSQALNGVVLITTKSGKKTKGLGINVSHQVTVEKPFSFIDFQNEYGSGTSAWDTATTILPNGQRVRTLRATRYSFGPKFDGSQVMRYDSMMVPYQAYPNNFIDFFKTGSSNRTNVAISGGGAFGSARASFSHVDYQDIIDRSTQKNNTFSFNGNFNVSPFAKFEFTSNIYSITTRNRRPNLEQVVAFGLNRDYDYNFLRNFYLDENGYRRILDNYALPPSATRFTGLLWEQNQNTDLDKKFHTITSLKTTLNFTKQISLLGQAAIDYTNTDYTTENQIVQLLPQVSGGKFQWRKQNTMVQSYQALLNYEQGFMHDNLHIFAYGGWAYQQVNETDVFAGTGEDGLRFPDWFSIGNDLLTSGALSKVRGVARGSDLIYGILGSVTASWKNKIYLQIDSRKDWNSTLPPSHNSYYYPGVSVIYHFTNDIKIPKLNYGKINASWADVGGGPNVALQNRYFADNSSSVQSIYEGATIIGVVPPTALFLGDIKPFRKREFEIGLDTRWLRQDRLELELTFYTNNIYNQIIPLNINPATGYATANINSGNVKNWGYELFVKASPFVTTKYRWNLTFTAARQLSKVMKLYEGINEQLIDGINNAVRVVGKVGQPLGDIYMYDFLRDPNGNKVVDQGTGLYSLDNTKYIKVGNVNPKAFGGLYSDFYFKGFNFHIGLDYKFGGTIFSYSNQYLMGNGVIKATLPYRDEAHGGLTYTSGGITYHDGVILPGVKKVDLGGGNFKYDPNDKMISATTYYSSYINDVSTSWPPDRVFKNDYIKLREISIDYTLPKKISGMLKLQKVSVNLAARNLGYLHKTIPNIDPESTLSSQGFVEDSFYPTTRTFSFGINISF
ncbi:MAG: SusC/RagA family TonB-linked outer membrane protein [Bacteroidota bacterium]|nr:SusC/RagA family TonB-linked outer membrane protein [Bacteroidota bacterium]